MNDDEEQSEVIGLTRTIFNLIPNIRNQRRPFARFNDTLDKETDLDEIANPCGKQRGGR